MDREIQGRPTADYLWNVKEVVPILKVDKGLADEADGAKVMKPMPNLDDLLSRAVDKGSSAPRCVRSSRCPARGSTRSSSSSSRSRRQILATGLVPIIEPEVDIGSPQRPRPRNSSRPAFSISSTSSMTARW